MRFTSFICLSVSVWLSGCMATVGDLSRLPPAFTLTSAKPAKAIASCIYEVMTYKENMYGYKSTEVPLGYEVKQAVPDVAVLLNISDIATGGAVIDGRFTWLVGESKRAKVRNIVEACVV